MAEPTTAPSAGELLERLARVPDELKALPQWVCWRYETRDGKRTKVPRCPSNAFASVADIDTWSSFDRCVEAWSDSRRRFDGVAFMFSDADPYLGIDLDHCIADDQLAPWAQQVLGMLPSYAEVSPSGTGVKVICRAVKPGDRCRTSKPLPWPSAGPGAAVEIYSRVRLFTVTGALLDGHPATVADCQAGVDRLYHDLFPPPAPRPTVEPNGHGHAVDLTDDELLEKARTATNGEKFRRLYDQADTSVYGGDDSSADFALLMILAFWTHRDAGRMERLFSTSALGQREKWRRRQDYRDRSIAHAIDLCTECYGDHARHQPRRAPGAGAAAGPEGEGDRPRITISNRGLDELVEATLAALVEANDPPTLFMRDGHLVRVRTTEREVPVIEAVDWITLREHAGRAATWVRLKKEGDGWTDVLCSPPRDVVESCLKTPTLAATFPALEAVTTVPTLRPDGTVLDRPGYDPATRLYYAPPAGLVVPPVPEAPTEAERTAALERIEELLADFPFADDASRANVIAALLGPVVRPAVSGATPLHVISAPQRGTGKTLLAELVALVATGTATATPAPERARPEEWQKVLLTLLGEGRTVVLFDNIDGTLRSGALAGVLTASVWSDRLLSVNRTGTYTVRATWIATGNNLQLGGDLPRRAVWTRLDAKTSRPYKRTGFRIPNLPRYALEHRGELLAALLTLARAWYAAGCPAADVPRLGKFESWCEVLGGILAHAGVNGFLANFDAEHDQADEDGQAWEAFLEGLEQVFGGAPFTVADITDRVKPKAKPKPTKGDQAAEGDSQEATEDLDDEGRLLLDVMLPWCLRDDGTVNARSLGKHLAGHVGHRHGDDQLRLEKAANDKSTHRARYVVAADADPEDDPAFDRRLDTEREGATKPLCKRGCGGSPGVSGVCSECRSMAVENDTGEPENGYREGVQPNAGNAGSESETRSTSANPANGPDDANAGTDDLAAEASPSELFGDDDPFEGWFDVPDAEGDDDAPLR